MRITNSLLFNTSIRNYRSATEKLYNINQQIDSKLKIQNSYENTSVYVDAMRLNNEIDTLDQSKQSSSKAKTFADNTDSALSSFTSSLDQFKSKLVQASSTSNSTTSLQALANDLQGIKDNLVSLANTSVNGQFLFSGSALSQKPIANDGTYRGNSENLTAVIGSGVQLPYNITGQSLFLGKDSDYNRVVSTNVSMYNQSKLHPDIMTTNSQNTASSQVYLQESDTIRDLVGDTNNSATDDGKAVFYLSGRKSDGTTFSNVLSLDTSSKVSDLLQSIGNSYGNTASNKVVDVSMNARGQIEVKDLKSGSQLLDMNIFGAIDRNALPGETGNAKQIMNVDNLLTQPNVDIIAFNKSNYETTASSPDLTMRSVSVTTNTFAIDFPMQNKTDSSMTSTTLLSSVFPSDVDHLDFGATSFSTSGKTVQDLMTAVETEYGLAAGSVTVSNGRMLVNDPTNTFNTVIQPKNASNVLAHGDSIPDAMNYARRGFEKDGSTLSSNISQVIKSTSDFATSSTKLVDVAGVNSLNGKQIVLNFTDKNGVQRTGTLNLDISNTTFSVDLDGNGVATSDPTNPAYNPLSPNETFSIYNGSGDPLNLNTTADNMTYQQLNDLISMATSGNLPKQGVSTAAQTAINNAIAFGVAGDAANLAAQTTIAKTGISTETAGYIQKAIDAGIIRDNPASSPAEVTKATSDYNNAIGNANLAEYNFALSTAKNSVDVNLDSQGKIVIKDKTSSASKIDFTMYDASATDFTGVGSSALTFMANNSVTISNPSIDMFKQLDEMIAAVRTGTFRMDSTSDDPRNIGIQNALTQLDHIADHVTKAQTKIGALTNALTDANTRSEMLSVNVKAVQNSVIGVDTAEAYLEFQSINTAYQAMLSTMSKINSMSLLDYM
ncbi:flagellin [Sulfurospirillum diekertiae]|uniref:Flagellin n=1 Tax=Sulfurospirillum diekertiae TaxID=1854492 RepID=A0A6G9VQ60_9BACT|nr:flagellin [Sulfurospirillum diekertiae]QIR74755.1 flagellin [Sulfurospirillum diekertiae]QIR77418.1 flagellin [Sulfurospirillum diekertiae]